MSETIQYKFRDRLRDSGIMVSVGVGIGSPVHSHDCIELSYVSDGSAETLIDGKKVTVKKGDYFLIDLGETHGYISSSGSFPVINIRFLPFIINYGLPDGMQADEIASLLCAGGSRDTALPETLRGKIFHDKKSEVFRLFRKVRHEWEKKEPGWQRIAGDSLAAIFINMVRNEELPGENTKNSFIVSHIVSYVDMHYAEPVQLTEICRLCNYTMSYVSRVFSESMGQSFSSYLIQIRVNKACELLENTNMTVSRIGRAVGYSNTAFFYSAFEEKTGMTPREWRLEHSTKK